VIAQAPIRFDRATGVLQGTNAWERFAAMTLVAGTRISSLFSYRGYNGCANLLRKTLPARDIDVALNADAVFAFPYGDGYWSKLLYVDYCYERELELLLLGSRDIDYVLVDCGANYGYWSVLATSQPFGAHKAIAIEPSADNFPKLANNVRLNNNRFEALKCAIGAARGTARLSGSKHEALSIAGDVADRGEDVPVIALDNLIDDGKIAAVGTYLVKLDVEGVEIEAIKGGTRLLLTDTMLLCEEHGSDRNHSVSRYILDNTPLKLFVHDPASGRFEAVTQLSILDRIKVATNIGYNVFATSSAFWVSHIGTMNANAARNAQRET
jgi:FkbM family methyltransferase